MATIDDIHAVERLMQTLDENPHLMEAVRSRILTRELLELPQTVARLTERVDRLTERMDRLTERMDRLTERMEAVERGINRLRDDFGEFRADVAGNAALKNAAAIAGVAGLIRTRNVSQDELMAMTRANDTTGIARNDLDSFHHADLVMEATDDNGQVHYVTVEVSYTADERDTRRAIRNAGYMTRFTGLPAHAVIVAARIDRRIDYIINSGQIHWYQLRERAAQRE
ncbi:MAG: hypothetical protein OXL37_03995 [Chloroflexota bacterium]|nr:hypothetical protein [Chloroflexota bacterium]MDE2958519.1 hypothetical protein [Chloroflexota bacterium]